MKYKFKRRPVRVSKVSNTWAYNGGEETSWVWKSYMTLKRVSFL